MIGLRSRIPFSIPCLSPQPDAPLRLRLTGLDLDYMYDATVQPRSSNLKLPIEIKLRRKPGGCKKFLRSSQSPRIS